MISCFGGKGMWLVLSVTIHPHFSLPPQLSLSRQQHQHQYQQHRQHVQSHQ